MVEGKEGREAAQRQWTGAEGCALNGAWDGRSLLETTKGKVFMVRRTTAGEREAGGSCHTKAYRPQRKNVEWMET